MEFKDANWLGQMLELQTKLDFGLFIGRQSAFINKIAWPYVFGSPMSIEWTFPFILYQDKPYLTKPERHLQTQFSVSTSFSWSDVFSWYITPSLRMDRWSNTYRPYSPFSNASEMFERLDGLLDVLSEPPKTRIVLEPGIHLVDVDNVFDPHQGFRFRLFSQFSTHIAGTDPAFVLVGTQFAYYLPLSESTLVFGGNAQRALIESPKTNWWVLKYQSDMDILGGDRGPRGFPEGSIGVLGPSLDDEGRPDLGNQNIIHPGNWLLNGSMELRFPLLKKLLLGDLYGALFVDGGMVGFCDGLFACESGIEHGEQYGVSIGVGLRYILPIGPLLVDAALSPHREGDGPFYKQGRVHILFGYPF